MNRLLLIVFFVDLAVLLGVGGRLLWVARRTRRAPEAAIGTSAACGSLGILLSLIATVILDRGDGSFPIWAAGTLVRAIGVCGLSIGCWRIYRPTESWAGFVAVAGCAVALVGCGLRVGPGTIPASVDPSLGQLLMNAAGLFVYLWSSGEAVRYHLRMRRRVALGLGDAMIAQQFAFWAISGLAAAGAAATATFYTFVLEASILRAPVPFTAVQLALFISAIGLWFAFFPPAFYRRRVSARAPAAG